MATSYKLLGQSAPGATTATTLYTVPSSTETVISTLSITNRGTGQGTYRVALRPNGDTLANEHYLTYDAIVPANDMIALTVGITLDAGDIVTVYASTADFTFQAFGAEIS